MNIYIILIKIFHLNGIFLQYSLFYDVAVSGLFNSAGFNA